MHYGCDLFIKTLIGRLVS